MKPGQFIFECWKGNSTVKRPLPNNIVGFVFIRYVLKHYHKIIIIYCRQVLCSVAENKELQVSDGYLQSDALGLKLYR